MASSSGDRNVLLQSSFSSKRSQVNFVEKELLSITDAYDKLATEGISLNDSGKKMLETLNNMKPQSFEYIQHEFPVKRLQHVTDKSSMEGIYKEERFKITISAFRCEFRDFSFWSADIAPKDISEGKKKACKKAKEWINRQVSKTDENKIRAQFANSPAFKKTASRYGNFKFSFQLSDLLKWYQDQHCDNEEPKLKILGTDLYKQEITHYILVHSPDQSERFEKLEMVPTVEGSVGSDFVYLNDKKVYWRPESTSISLKKKFSKGSFGRKICPEPCKFYKMNGSCVHTEEITCVWNHLVFAFHLPNNRSLNIRKQILLKSLKACKIAKPALLDEDKWLDVKEAKDIIQQMKTDAKSQKRKSSVVLKGNNLKIE